jgi:hypothetical protein
MYSVFPCFDLHPSYIGMELGDCRGERMRVRRRVSSSIDIGPVDRSVQPSTGWLCIVAAKMDAPAEERGSRMNHTGRLRRQPVERISRGQSGLNAVGHEKSRNSASRSCGRNVPPRGIANLKASLLRHNLPESPFSIDTSPVELAATGTTFKPLACTLNELVEPSSTLPRWSTK